ncbi:hypothetical protein CBOM_06148 [Ceraceosorus bombacis]|uniref:Uncharacterized protein n=1 Tax=Ceraceosorus bombacis TaxID=401625 RepID=A0A0P1BIW5_9BASI|nr:hypothetical protein CBOM_06148 [Ceraceosorus bombacis]
MSDRWAPGFAPSPIRSPSQWSPAASEMRPKNGDPHHYPEVVPEKSRRGKTESNPDTPETLSRASSIKSDASTIPWADGRYHPETPRSPLWKSASPSPAFVKAKDASPVANAPEYEKMIRQISGRIKNPQPGWPFNLPQLKRMANGKVRPRTDFEKALTELEKTRG